MKTTNAMMADMWQKGDAYSDLQFRVDEIDDWEECTYRLSYLTIRAMEDCYYRLKPEPEPPKMVKFGIEDYKTGMILTDSAGDEYLIVRRNIKYDKPIIHIGGLNGAFGLSEIWLDFFQQDGSKLEKES